jgi:hypothetical protein
MAAEFLIEARGPVWHGLVGRATPSVAPSTASKGDEKPMRATRRKDNLAGCAGTRNFNLSPNLSPNLFSTALELGEIK